MNSASTRSVKQGAIFLDRDGVINHNRSDYVKSWAEFQFLPHSLTALRILANLAVSIVVISNQSPIGRGLITNADVDDIHEQMQAQITAHGGRIDGIYYCPHHPDDNCTCRKPQPGLLIAAASELDLDLQHSYFVGDAATDVAAALAAGCQPILVRTGRGEHAYHTMPTSLHQHCHVFSDLLAFAHHIQITTITARNQQIRANETNVSNAN